MKRKITTSSKPIFSSRISKRWIIEEKKSGINNIVKPHIIYSDVLKIEPTLRQAYDQYIMEKLLSPLSSLFCLLCFANITSVAQPSEDIKSTNDLSFLLGTWDIARTYGPDSDEERVLMGTLVCEGALDDQFIKCTYEMERAGKIRGLDVVYYNYNSIYKLYESVWLSSTWPIKGILQGNLDRNIDQHTLRTSGQFKIENDITEYVKDELIAPVVNLDLNSFTRHTHIRTSEYEEGVWYHHMIEHAKKRE